MNHGPQVNEFEGIFGKLVELLTKLLKLNQFIIKQISSELDNENSFYTSILEVLECLNA